MSINSPFTIRVVIKFESRWLYCWSTCRWLMPCFCKESEKCFSRVAGQHHEADGDFHQQVAIFDNPALYISMLRFVNRMEYQASLYRRVGGGGGWRRLSIECTRKGCLIYLHSRANRKTCIPAWPSDKQLSNFAYLRQVLVLLFSYLVGNENFLVVPDDCMALFF